VTRVDAPEVADGRRADDALGPHLTDDPGQVAAKIERGLDATIGVAEPVQLRDADELGCGGLLRVSDLPHVVA